MDKDQARFILQSFRPDGADAKDPDFAEALAVAAEDRELGDWLANERAQDAAFAAALNNLAIPEDLRENILGVLKGEQNSEEAGDDFANMDAAFIGALASVRPPAGLRDQIVSAMKVETTNGTSDAGKAKTAPRRVSGWLKTAAIAAALVLGAFVALELTGPGSGDPPKLAENAKFTLKSLEYGSIRSVSQSNPDFAMRNSNLSELSSFAGSKNLAAVSAEDLPAGLSDGKAVGCRLLNIDEENVALYCFDKNGKTVHLVVVPREDVDLKGKKLDPVASLKSGKGHCWRCPKTEIAVAAWNDDEHTFLLLGDMDEEELRKFF